MGLMSITMQWRSDCIASQDNNRACSFFAVGRMTLGATQISDSESDQDLPVIILKSMEVNCCSCSKFLKEVLCENVRSMQK